MSEIKPVAYMYDLTLYPDDNSLTVKDGTGTKNPLELEVKGLASVSPLYPAAAYEALKEKLERLNGLYHSEVSKHQLDYNSLKAESEAQAQRIAELDEHVTKLGSGSRQHLYQAFARRYKEILSLRRENEALRKQVEMLLGSARKTVLALAHASIHDPLYTAAYDELSESIKLASKNGEVNE